MQTRSVRCLRSLATLVLAAAAACGTTPSPIGPGGAITIPPGGPVVILPPGANVSIRPNPIPSPVNTTGTTVTVKVLTAGGSTTIANVPIVVELSVGADGAQTSLIDAGVNLATGGRLVGAKLTTATDATGVLTFMVKATTDGEDEVITITTDPGARQNVQTFNYATVNP